MIVIFILLYITLIGIFISNDIHSEKSVLRVAFVKATIVLSTLFYVSTEVLSALDAISTFPSIILWVIFTLITVYISWRNRPDFLQIIYSRIRFFFQEKDYLLYGILIACIPLLFLTLYVPTTNNDSLNYHVSRVIYWIYNQDVDFFPTLNGRQLYYSPFAEYIILQLQLVTQKIWYANLPQFMSMIGTCVIVSLISEQLYHHRLVRNISVFLMFTLPIGLFESTTTQNDYVATLYTIASIYFLMQSYRRLQWSSIILFSLSLGLSGLTKYSGWVFASPFYLFFAVLILKKYRLQIVKYIPVILVVYTLIVTPFAIRSVKNFDSLLGPKKGDELYYDVKNDYFHPINTISTTIKNMGTAAATPIPIINQFIKNVVVISHRILGEDVDDKQVNFLGLPYSNSFSFHEDRASNFIHFWLFILAIVPLFFVKRRRENLIYLGLLWSSWILFSTFFKWQPWHSRMELIWFALLMPFLANIYVDFLKKQWIRYLLFGTMSVHALLVILVNPSKQIIPLMNLSRMMPSFFSENDMKLLAKNEALKSKVEENTTALKEFGLSFYLAKDQVNYTDQEKEDILNHLNFPRNQSIYQKSYVERMMPLDMTIYHQMQQMMKQINLPNARIGTSFLAGTREFLVLYPLSIHPNVRIIKNIAYPKSLAQTSHAKEEYTYDYLLTNNFQIFDQMDLSTVEEVYDFAYFKLFKFHQPQQRKYLVKDILQDFTM